MLGWLFKRRGPVFKYTCECCGEVHEGAPSYAYRYPTWYFSVPEEERAARVTWTEDLCEIKPGAGIGEETLYAIRAVLEIPILGTDDVFTWGVWVTQSQESFHRYGESFGADQAGMSSFGWLPVTMPPYLRGGAEADTEYLECEVRWGPKGQRPKVELWGCDHPVFLDQRDGITVERAIAMAKQLRVRMH